MLIHPGTYPWRHFLPHTHAHTCGHKCTLAAHPAHPLCAHSGHMQQRRPLRASCRSQDEASAPPEPSWCQHCHRVAAGAQKKRERNGISASTLIHSCWFCKIVQFLLKEISHYLLKLKMQSPSKIAVPLMGVYKCAHVQVTCGQGYSCSLVYNKKCVCGGGGGGGREKKTKCQSKGKLVDRILCSDIEIL
uniref:Uncharacterized protein n=1 Tax=Myotis myotis TaxID=51298 RepID=A0A7J7XHL6_MYOMY|nr:hypothetical protein mMyoMyo1_011710 [Myotis myotis]